MSGIKGAGSLRAIHGGCGHVMQVTSLYRYPVKGLSPERLERVTLERGAYFPEIACSRSRTALPASIRQSLAINLRSSS
jgi:hypothetical protein